jgi:hypothetical protein
MRVVLTAPIPGVNTPSLPFGEAMLTGLRIRCSPLCELQMKQDDVTSHDDLQGGF